MHYITVTNALVSAILDGVALSEAAKLELIAEIGLTPDRVRDVNGRTSIATLSRLWKRIIVLTDDDFPGLTVGATVPSERFGLAVHTAQNKATVREGFAALVEYAGLINALIACRLEESETAGTFAMKFFWDVFDLERHAVDITFASVVKWGADRLCTPFPLREVRLRHARTDGRERYASAFRVPIVFGATTNEVVFDRAVLDVRINGNNPELGLFLDGYARGELAKLPALASLPARVSQILVRELEAGKRSDPGSVCQELQTTPRNLQRKLSEAATSFSTLLDGACKAVAPAWLDAPAANVEQVGFRLGYADPTAFIRAFKRWYGMTPGEYRKTRQLL